MSKFCCMFQKFKQTISDCLTHVIGTVEQRPITPGTQNNEGAVSVLS